jgi:hypothetical protein
MRHPRSHIHRLASIILVLALFGSSWDISAEGASPPPTVSVTVPAGQWKTVRLRNVPRDTVVGVALRCDGLLTVGLLDAPDHAQFPRMANPLFWGQAESKLGFSATIPQQGDYFVVLDNREGDRPRQVTMTTTARLGGETAKNLVAAQLQKVEAQLKALEAQLNRTFMFDPIPIRVNTCKHSTPFERVDGLTLCLQYARRLMETFQDKTQASDALVFSMFHEMAQLFQQQWGLDPANPSVSLDELTTVLMLTFRLDANVRAYAQTLINQPALSTSLADAFNDPLHPLTVERAQRVLKWATDPTLVQQWQAQLVPHMQTKMLQQLKDHPQPWSDRQLIDAELAERARNPSIDLPTVRPKGRIKA